MMGSSELHVVAITYSSLLQLSGFSILYPRFKRGRSSALVVPGYGTPPVRL